MPEHRNVENWTDDLRLRLMRAGCNGATLATLYKSTATDGELRVLATDALASRVNCGPAWMVGVLKKRGQLPHLK